MEICFVSSGVRDFIEEQVRSHPERYPEVGSAGSSDIVDQGGSLLGSGDPYYRYTVGQRRGLGVASQERLYVLSLDSTRNRVVVGSGDELDADGLIGERQHWIGAAPEGEIEATVKIRSRHPGIGATIRPRSNGGVEVEFASPQRGVAPGQAAVFYQGSRVLGGCWILSALKPAWQKRS
ncbi:MAG: hypothetical protein P8Y44_03715 [Acidobacteriota bacterium]